MRTIGLTKGYEAIVDDVDYEWLSGFSWFAAIDGRGYVYAARQVRDGARQRTLKMHRAIVECDSDCIDHINGDTLDNRRENLRPATKSQNCVNKQRWTYKAKLPGAYRTSSKGAKPWMSQMKHNGEMHYLGVFDTAEEAHSAWVKKHIELHGEFSPWYGREAQRYEECTDAP